jgi:hypothetical protein
MLGCGGAPPPTSQLATTQAALRAANEVGAPSEPQAALHLKLAKEQLDKAKALMEEDENEQALDLLLRAEVDAELAHALAKEASTKAEAEDAKAALEKLMRTKK